MRFLKLILSCSLLLCSAVAIASSTVILPANPTAAAEDQEFQKAFRELPDAEKQLLVHYMMRSAIGSAIAGVPIANITIAEAIADQKAFEDKKKARQKEIEEEERAEEAKAQALTNAVAIENIKIEKATESGYREGAVKVSVTVRNLTEKPIAGVKVGVRANDVFGDNLGSYGLKSATSVQPQGEITLDGHYEGSKVLEAGLSKVSVSAEPVHIVFEDRTELKKPGMIIGF